MIENNNEVQDTQVLSMSELAAVHGGSTLGDLTHALNVTSGTLGAHAIVAAFVPVPGARILAAGLGLTAGAFALASSFVSWGAQNS